MIGGGNAIHTFCMKLNIFMYIWEKIQSALCDFIDLLLKGSSMQAAIFFNCYTFFVFINELLLRIRMDVKL